MLGTTDPGICLRGSACSTALRLSHSAASFSSVGHLCLGAIFRDYVKSGDAGGDVNIAANMYSR